MRILTDKDAAILKRFDDLPDSAAVGLKTAALVTDTSERTWRRAPPIQAFFVSAGKRAANVGLLRKLSRGELA